MTSPFTKSVPSGTYEPETLTVPFVSNTGVSLKRNGSVPYRLFVAIIEEIEFEPDIVTIPS